MKQLGWVCGAALVVACGGRANAPETDGTGGTSGYAGSPTAEAGATNSAGAPGVGPIDTTGLATEFPEPLCAGPLASLHLALPCKVGQRLGGTQSKSGISVVECYDSSGRTALSFPIDLASAASSIGRSMPLPFNTLGAPPLPPVPSVALEVDGVQYTGTLKASLTFEQVDADGRAFVAFLTRELVAWTAADGTETDCDYDPMRLWATAGDFI